MLRYHVFFFTALNFHPSVSQKKQTPPEKERQRVKNRANCFDFSFFLSFSHELKQSELARFLLARLFLILSSWVCFPIQLVRPDRTCCEHEEADSRVRRRGRGRRRSAKEEGDLCSSLSSSSSCVTCLQSNYPFVILECFKCSLIPAVECVVSARRCGLIQVCDE